MEGPLITVIHLLTASVNRLTDQLHTQTVIDRINQLEKNIMKTQAELTEQLKAVAAGQVKSNAEIAVLQKKSDDQTKAIEALQKIINDGPEVSQELQDAVQAVADGQQALDDEIPDPVTPIAPV